jgi:hypothetical protein
VVKDEEYKVYPNPVSETLHIRYRQQGTAVFALFDLTGRKVSEAVLSGSSGTQMLSVKTLPSGMYFYRIMEDGVVKMSGKIIKE